MHTLPIAHAPDQSLHFDTADIQIRAQMVEQALTIDIMKAGMRVHRVTLNDAMDPLENSWLADLFAREHRVELGAIAREMDDYVAQLNINQG